MLVFNEDKSDIVNFDYVVTIKFSEYNGYSVVNAVMVDGMVITLFTCKDDDEVEKRIGHMIQALKRKQKIFKF